MTILALYANFVLLVIHRLANIQRSYHVSEFRRHTMHSLHISSCSSGPTDLLDNKGSAWDQTGLLERLTKIQVSFEYFSGEVLDEFADG